jgi:four helix bundle protein
MAVLNVTALRVSVGNSVLLRTITYSQIPEKFVVVRLRKTIRFRQSYVYMIRKRITNFLDLDVHQNAYKASIIALTKIIPELPRSEQYDLGDQLRRSVKAIPRLIAEGFAKRHQKKGFQKYLDDAIGESNETIVSLSHVKDVYRIETELIEKLIDTYDKAARQLYNLACAWESFGPRKPKPKDENESPFETDKR